MNKHPFRCVAIKDYSAIAQYFYLETPSSLTVNMGKLSFAGIAYTQMMVWLDFMTAFQSMNEAFFAMHMSYLHPVENRNACAYW